MEKLKINTDDPRENGMYVVYTDHEYMQRNTQQKILIWINGIWGYKSSDQKFRGNVYGWIGPLPIPKIEDLKSQDIKYAISILPDGKHGAFQQGPFASLEETLDEIGEDGQYIFELRLDQGCKPVRRWKNGKWLKRKR